MNEKWQEWENLKNKALAELAGEVTLAKTRAAQPERFPAGTDWISAKIGNQLFSNLFTSVAGEEIDKEDVRETVASRMASETMDAKYGRGGWR